MYTIVMTNDKQLVTTVQTTIYQKDNLVDKIQFLFPSTYGDLNLEECTVQFQYTDNANTVHDVILEKDEYQYKDKLRYRFSIGNDLTKFAGSIIGHIKFTKVDEDSGETQILHTGDTAITVLPTRDFSFEDNQSGDLEDRLQTLEDKVSQLYDMVEQLVQ